jgi:NAD(P) transhydrogenase subunit beta
MSGLPPSSIQMAYLASASLFIMGLHYLNSPSSARRGNKLASLGMLIAVAATLVDRNVVKYDLILGGMLIGAVIGYIASQKVKMTAMPQMVGLFNGFGGGASALVAMGEYWRLTTMGAPSQFSSLPTLILGLFIGGVTFTGSLVAFGKLQGLLRGAPITFPFQQVFNAALLVLFISGGAYLLFTPFHSSLFFALVVISLILGFLLVIPIGGADMPVVISLLNSFSGLAAAVAGFILDNNVLIVSGALVGAAGIILTQLMSRAMNRSIFNILFSAFGEVEGVVLAGGGIERSVRSIDTIDAAMMLAYAGRVIVVPGYGLAAARAQHAVRELADQLEKRGVGVKYAIHPVAGRMPGHMNVLLAEADVPYTELYDMDDINPEFERTDVALVVGANDVVNPAARSDVGSPIYGMPILDVDKARSVIVVKRSLNPGFSGVDNELFYGPKTSMLFGDARDIISKVVGEVKKL